MVTGKCGGNTLVLNRIPQKVLINAKLIFVIEDGDFTVIIISTSLVGLSDLENFAVLIVEDDKNRQIVIHLGL